MSAIHFNRSIFSRALLAFGVSALAVTAQGAEWPSAKPIRVFVPYTAGGPTDTITRTVMQKLSQRLKQTIIIENRPGANGMIGTAAAAHSEPDGYNFLSVVAAYSINPIMYKSATYKVSDLAPVSQLADIPLFLYTRNNLAAKSVKELMSHAHANGKGLTYASSGTGSGAHLTGAYLASLSGAPMTHIPYKGAAAFVADLLGEQVDMAFDTVLLEMPYVKSGKLKVLAVASEKRWPEEPNIPTMEEAGYPGFVMNSWAGFLAPVGTPPEIIQRVSAEIDEILKLPDVKANFRSAGFLPVGGTPEQFKTLVGQESKKYEKIIKATGVTLN